MNFPLGIGLLLVGALMNGNFVLPMKCARRWNWEVIWSVYTVLALVIVPWAGTLVRVPDWFAVLASCTSRELFVPVLFGFGWGVAQVLYGLGVTMLGIALGSSLIVGIAATLGSAIPLVVLHPERVVAREGVSILVGLVLMLIGIFFCGLAGKARERQQASQAESVSRRYMAAVLVCVLCGILAPMMTFALAFGAPVMNQAVSFGATPADATYLLWALVLPSGASVSLAYCGWLMKRNHSWKQFWLPRTKSHWALAAAMAVLWAGGVILYGMSTVYLGALGVPIAQAIFVIFVILGANLTGFLTGEWRGAYGAPVRSLAAGIAFLTLACAVIALGNR